MFIATLAWDTTFRTASMRDYGLDEIVKYMTITICIQVWAWGTLYFAAVRIRWVTPTEPHRWDYYTA